MTNAETLGGAPTHLAIIHTLNTAQEPYNIPIGGLAQPSLDALADIAILGDPLCKNVSWISIHQIPGVLWVDFPDQIPLTDAEQQNQLGILSSIYVAVDRNNRGFDFYNFRTADTLIGADAYPDSVREHWPYGMVTKRPPRAPEPTIFSKRAPNRDATVTRLPHNRARDTRPSSETTITKHLH